MSRAKPPLHRMFTSVPPRYDLTNKVITLGLDGRWRRRAASVCFEHSSQSFLDICCGTGDLALEVARMDGQRGGAAERSHGRGARSDVADALEADGIRICALDFSEPMLEIAREKATAAGVGDRIEFVHGDASDLPYPDESFDCVGISFAFRNITYKNPQTAECLSETHRILRPSGSFVIVESSQPGSAFIRFCFHQYLRWYVAPIGGILTSQRGAYRYLATSVSRFYDPDELETLLKEARFGDVDFTPLLFGASGIWVAKKVGPR